MKLENTLMILLFGLLLIVLYFMLQNAYEIVNKSVQNSNSYDPGHWLFITFSYWSSLVGGLSFIIIGGLRLIKHFTHQ